MTDPSSFNNDPSPRLDIDVDDMHRRLDRDLRWDGGPWTPQGEHGEPRSRTFRDQWNELKADPNTNGWDWLNFGRSTIATASIFLIVAGVLVALTGLLAYVTWRDFIVGHGTMAAFPWVLVLFWFGALVVNLFAWQDVRDLW